MQSKETLRIYFPKKRCLLGTPDTNLRGLKTRTARKVLKLNEALPPLAIIVMNLECGERFIKMSYVTSCFYEFLK